MQFYRWRRRNLIGCSQLTQWPNNKLYPPKVIHSKDKFVDSFRIVVWIRKKNSRLILDGLDFDTLPIIHHSCVIEKHTRILCYSRCSFRWVLFWKTNIWYEIIVNIRSHWRWFSWYWCESKSLLSSFSFILDLSFL